VDLTPELARLALGRIAALREQKILDPNIVETYYWAYFAACYFSPYAGLAIDGMEAEGASILLGDQLHELQIEDKEIVCVPESFELLPGQVAAVECEQMIAYEASIAFMAIPKHTSFYVQTVEIPISLLEPALSISASATKA
jgi:hypothetical protein